MKKYTLSFKIDEFATGTITVSAKDFGSAVELAMDEVIKRYGACTEIIRGHEGECACHVCNRPFASFKP